jgi:hypothetical protein
MISGSVPAFQVVDAGLQFSHAGFVALLADPRRASNLRQRLLAWCERLRARLGLAQGLMPWLAEAAPQTHAWGRGVVCCHGGSALLSGEGRRVALSLGSVMAR